MRATKRIALIPIMLLALGVVFLMRPGHAQTAPPSQPRGMIATVDVVTLLEQMLQTDEYLEPREAMRAAIQAELSEGEQRLMALEQEIRSMNPNDPAVNQRYSDYQQLQQNLSAETQAKAAEYDKAGAAQAVAIYRRIRDAADVVGDRLGYHYVMASRSPDATMGEVNGLTAVTQQILARPILAGAENDDITADVRAELGLPEPSDEPESEDTDAPEDAGNATEPAETTGG